MLNYDGSNDKAYQMISSGNIVFHLGPAPRDHSLPSSLELSEDKEFLGWDVDSWELVFFNADEVREPDEEWGVAENLVSTSIFEGSLPMGTKLKRTSDGAAGIIIAINPILVPLTFRHEYLALFPKGETVSLWDKEIGETYNIMTSKTDKNR